MPCPGTMLMVAIHSSRKRRRSGGKRLTEEREAKDQKKRGQVLHKSLLRTRQMTCQQVEKGDDADTGQHAGNGYGNEAG